jgi:hypothetical protein
MAKKTIKEIKSALPGLDSSKVEAYADELDRILAIKRIFQSEDGRVLVNELRDNCSITIKKLLVIYHLQIGIFFQSRSVRRRA